jgi:ribosomal protein L20
MAGLKAAAVEVDRKMLAALALDNPDAFGELAALAKRAAGATA